MSARAPAPELTCKGGIGVVLMKGFDDSKEHRVQDQSRSEHGNDQMFGNEQPTK